MAAWNGWYHCIFNTYGTWLPGDGRGFRTRHHREHVEGDYKNPPPPGMHAKRHGAVKRLLRKQPVVFAPPQRSVVLNELCHAMSRQPVEVLVISVSAVHVHVLAKFLQGLRNDGPRTSAVDDPPRHIIGIAKRTSARRLLNAKLVSSAPVWARRGKVKPIRDRQHQVNTFHYIRDHANEGAAVWTFLDDVT